MKTTSNLVRQRWQNFSTKVLKSVNIPDKYKLSTAYSDNDPEIETLRERQGRKNIYYNRYADTSVR